MVKIWPVPAKKVLYVDAETVISHIEIIDIYGKLILKNSNQSTIELSSLSNGIYFIQIKVDGKTIKQHKFVVNK